MAASFPSDVKTFSDIVDGTNYMEGDQMNQAYDEIEALQTMVGATGSAASHTDSILSVFREWRHGCKVIADTVAQIKVNAGEVACVDSSGNVKLRRNTSVTTVTWADIDTGAEASSKRYYVHAVADSAATTFTVVISLSSTAPTGVTTFKLLGSFFNNASSNIEDVMDDLWLIGKEPGSGELWYTDTAPGGAILCDGAATVGTTVDPTLTDLHGVIGVVYGGADATDFQVPDLRGRFPLGQDDMGQGSANRVTDADADTLGNADGDEFKDISHDHTGFTGGVSFTGAAGSNTAGVLDTKHRHSISSDGSATQDIMPPFITVNYIIWK